MDFEKWWDEKNGNFKVYECRICYNTYVPWEKRIVKIHTLHVTIKNEGNRVKISKNGDILRRKAVFAFLIFFFLLSKKSLFRVSSAASAG